MNIKTWSTALLILCLCPAAMAQKAGRYLEKPLPQTWGTDDSHAVPGDGDLFSGQIQPIDDKWWKAFDDPMLDSLITAASTRNYSVLSAMDRMDMAKASLRIERGNFFPYISLDGGWTRQQSSGNVSKLPQSITGCIQRLAQCQLGTGRIRKHPPTSKGTAGNLYGKQGGIYFRHDIPLRPDSFRLYRTP